MIEMLSEPQVWVSLLTLTVLEIVLGIDNLIFLSIVANRAPEKHRDKVRKLGLAGALGLRLLLLWSIAWIAGLTASVFDLFEVGYSWRDIVLFGGGLFLIAKGTIEIHHSLEGDGDQAGADLSMGFTMAVVQIMALDVVFSLDSVITAVGIAKHIEVMVAAVLIAMAVMLFAAKPVGDFVLQHPTVKMLALAFLILVGTALVADGLHYHIERGFIYAAIAFSLLVEFLNLWSSARRKRRRAEKLGTVAE
ncbi:MAG: TerC family protein [Parvibaculaceae bacterium]|nr:TerC family protein [Parvibaculaceae bacterium]